MSINLKKNEGALKAAYEDVLNDASDTDWSVTLHGLPLVFLPLLFLRAVFGYEGNSNDLKVVETGGEKRKPINYS